MNAASTLNTFSLKDINQLRNPVIGLVESVREVVARLTVLRNRDDLHLILTNYFPKSKSKVLRSFFETNPSAWWDFIRKLNKYKREREGDPRSVYVDESHIADIMETLLIRWRREDIGEKLLSEMRASLNDPSLIRFASKQPSIWTDQGIHFQNWIEKCVGIPLKSLFLLDSQTI